MPTHAPDEIDTRDMPPGMVRMLFLGVFFTFAPVGALLMMIRTPPAGWLSGVVSMTLSGLIGLGWCSTFVTRRYWFLLLVIPFSMVSHWLSFTALSRIRVGGSPLLNVGMGLSPTQRLAILSAMAIVALAAGYIYTIRVTRMWERTHARTRAELDLAARVHQAIVPPLTIRTPAYEILGRSDPCSEMGGDLIDVVRQAGVTDVYVVDVSGHGVGAGLVMGMIKSALRMRLRSRGALDHVLTDLNAVVCDLTRPEMFATLACMRLHDSQDGAAEFALAGHLPILLARAGAAPGTPVEQLPNDHLPLGVMANETLTCGSVSLRPGDTLAFFTDGLVEVLDAKGHQFGLERFVRSFADVAGQPLEQIQRQLMAAARSHGVQIDDQSLVLVRRVG
jgi:serine phosphatase RsbU (regulator of sigma subunit)